MTIRIGTCGYRYYDPGEGWQEEAIEEFEFSLKAWQAPTHTNRSPTWHGEREGFRDEQKEHFGYLEPHEVVFDAWADWLYAREPIRHSEVANIFT